MELLFWFRSLFGVEGADGRSFGLEIKLAEMTFGHTLLEVGDQY